MRRTGGSRELNPAVTRTSTIAAWPTRWVARVRCGVLKLAVLVPLATCAADEPRELLGRVEGVADGDTLTVSVDGSRHRVRLHQIDAPEMDQPGAEEARRALRDKVDGRYVRLDVVTVDEYGRLVAGVHLGDRDINRELVREGNAWAYRRYLEDSAVLDDERAARVAERGLWAQSDPVAPWDWRRSRRSSSSARSDDCRIKGNISRRGDRIYHLPGDPDYARTRIAPGRGERWFCSEAEARRAGWRHARSR